MGWQEKINAAKKAERMRQMIAMEPPPIRYIFLLVLLLLLLGTSFADNWTIDGGRIYWGNANAEISVYPAFSNNLINHVQYANFSWNGTPITVNVSFLFDKPISYGRVDLWQNVTREYLVEQPARVNYSYRVDNVTGYAPSTNPCDLGDLQNALRYLVNYTQNGTPMQGVACFNSFSNISNNYTLIYSLNGTIFVPQNQTRPEWTDISGLFSEWRNESYPNYRAYTINNVAFTNPTLYQTRLTYETPLNLSSGKYSIYIHAGSPLDVVNGFAPVYLELDPWWSSNWTVKVPITVWNTTSEPNFPQRIVMNTSNAAWWNTTTCTNVRFLDSTETQVLFYDLESSNTTFCGNSTNNATFYVTGNYTNGSLIYAYLGNVNASSGEDAATVWSLGKYISVYHAWDGNAAWLLDATGRNNMSNHYATSACGVRTVINGRPAVGINGTSALGCVYTNKTPIAMPPKFGNVTITSWAKATPSAVTLVSLASAGGYGANIYGNPTYLFFSDGGNTTARVEGYSNGMDFYAIAYNNQTGMKYAYHNLTNNSSAIGDNMNTLGAYDWFAIGSVNPITGYEGYGWSGNVSEVRIRNVTSTAGWLRAEYGANASVGSPSEVFVTFIPPTPNASQHWLGNFTVNVTHQDIYTDCRLYLNNSSSSWNYPMVTVNSTECYLNNMSLVRGSYQYYANAHNSTNPVSNASTETRLIIIDNTPPPIPNPTSPKNYTNYTQDLIALQWNASSDFDNDNLSYDVCFDITSPPSNCISVQNLSRTVLVMQNGTHYWRVRAYDGFNFSNYSDTFQFNMTEDYPSVNITTANGTSFVGLSVTIAVQIYDSTMRNCSFVVIRAGGIEEQNTTFSCSSSSFAFNTMTFANYTVEVYVRHVFNDTVMASGNFITFWSPSGGGGGGGGSSPAVVQTNNTTIVYQGAPPSRPVNFAGIPFTGELDCFFKGMTRLFSANIPNYWLWVTAPYVLYLLVNISLASLSGKGLFLGAIDYGIFIIWMAGLINYFPPQVMC